MAFTKETTTVVTYKLDSSKTEFDIPFDYLARDFIYVTVSTNAGNVSELTLGADYNFISDTAIKTTSAYGNSGWSLLTIRRYTSTVPVTSFVNGSVLRARDLNVANIQAMHIAEEARDNGNDLIQVNTNGDFDALSKKIVNLADGVNPNDAVNKGQLDNMYKDLEPIRDETKLAAEAAEAARKAAESVLITAFEPNKAQTYLYECKGGEVTINLPFVPVTLMTIVNGIFQYPNDSYILDGSYVTFTTTELVKGDRILFYMNPPEYAQSNNSRIVSTDPNNFISYGTDGAAYFSPDKNMAGLIKDVTSVETIANYTNQVTFKLSSLTSKMSPYALLIGGVRQLDSFWVYDSSTKTVTTNQGIILGDVLQFYIKEVY